MLDLLALSPVQATQAGYHEHDGRSLDSELDDFSPAAYARELDFLRAGRECFAKISTTDSEVAADIDLIRDAIASQTFALQRRTYRTQPQDYVEIIGSGIFFPLTQSSGTPDSRLRAVISRIEQIPRALEQAKANLTEADPVFLDAAVEENDGNKQVIELVGTMIPASSPLRARYDAAAKSSLAAATSFSNWMKEDLAKRPHVSTWRTGPEVYREIFKFALGPGAHDTPQSLLAAAEDEQGRIRAQMYALAKPLHEKWFADHHHGDLNGEALQNKIITEVIDRINEDHTTPERLLDTVKSQAREIREFIVSKDLVTLYDGGSINIVPTPKFLRGIYSVAGAYPAPALDTTGSSQYWVTPIEPGTPPSQAESKLREYNNWMLQYLTMHEALPGHYTQFGHANRLQPLSRRIVRNLLGSGPYVEGWGDYGVKEMIDAGYSNHDPRFELMFLKIRMRVATNAVLDIRMQSMNMSDQEALNMMENKAFQSHAEAMGKLRRAKLSSGQLITYFVGYRQWNELRDQVQHALGSKFDLKRFNDAALDEGPLPIPLLEPLLMKRLEQ